MSWAVFEPEPGVGHVVPEDDGIGHTLTEDCVCGVETEPVPRDDGSMGWIFTHASLDGRELTE